MARKSAEEVETEVSFPTFAFEIDSDVELGPRSRLSPRQAKYPFDLLQVGQSFHVPKTEDMPNPSITLAGAVTNANNRWASETGQYEEKDVSVFQTDAAGKRIKNEKGAFTKIGTEKRQVAVLQYERHFTIRSAQPDDVRGPGARVFRDM